MLSKESSGDLGSFRVRGDVFDAGVEEEVDLAVEVSLQAADDLHLGVAFGGLLRDVRLRSWIEPEPANNGQVEGAVSLSVSAAVEAVALCHSGCGGQRRDAAEHRERGFGSHPVRGVYGGDEELPGDFDADPDSFGQLRSEGFDDGVDQVIEVRDLIGYLEVSPAERLQRDPVGDYGVSRVGDVGAPGGEVADQLHAGEVSDLIADFVWRCNDRHP